MTGTDRIESCHVAVSYQAKPARDPIFGVLHEPEGSSGQEIKQAGQRPVRQQAFCYLSRLATLCLARNRKRLAGWKQAKRSLRTASPVVL